MDNIAKEAKMKKVMTYFWIILLLILAIGSFTAYFLGYRFKDNFTLGKSGTLTLVIPLAETSIFIDNSQKIVTTKENEVVTVPLSPKTHSVIIGRDRYFPWTKDFVVPSEGNVTLSPIFVSQNASGQLVTQKDPAYWEIRGKIIRDIVPTEKSPLKSADGKVSLWVDDNAIMVQSASSTTKVIQPDTVVQNVSFYKDRSDAIIFSTFNGVYVIETDTSSTQNFIPIYKGTNPAFLKDSNDYIYVLDGDSLMQVVI